MDLFSAVLLRESHLSQDGCKDHPRTMDPGQCLVQTDGSARLGTGYLGRPDRKVSSRAVQSHRRRTQTGMQVTVVLLVCFPPANAELMSVAAKGSMVINPSR